MLLHALYEQQIARIIQTSSYNHRLATELSVIRAEIAHLSSRPVKEAHVLVEKFQATKCASRTAEERINTLENVKSQIKKDIFILKVEISKKEQHHSALIRSNLRIHQLTQFACKAHSLEHEQIQLVESKQQELKKLKDELNFMSRVWANERQLKLNTNQQLKEKLSNLANSHLMPKRNKQKWYQENLLKEFEYDSTITYELFGALCKEIRRLQTRSANLIDALDTLSSKNSPPTVLEGIRALVHQTSNSKSKLSSPFFRRENNFDQSSCAPCRVIDNSEIKVIARPIFRSIPTTSSPGNEEVTKNHLVCVDSRNHSCPISSTSIDNHHSTSQSNTKDSQIIRSVRQPNRTFSQNFGTHLRRRPLSFYMRRSFESVLEGSIPEVDVEQDIEDSL